MDDTKGAQEYGKDTKIYSAQKEKQSKEISESVLKCTSYKSRIQ